MPGAGADNVGDTAGLDVELAFREGAIALGAGGVADDEIGEPSFATELGAGAGSEGRKRGKVGNAVEVDGGNDVGRAAKPEVEADADATGRGEGAIANTPGRASAGAPTGWERSDCA
jgi:hypothetical protein